jgi:hypothetical protein
MKSAMPLFLLDDLLMNLKLLTGWTVPPVFIASLSFCEHRWACTKRMSCCVMSFLFSGSWLLGGPPGPASPGGPGGPPAPCWPACPEPWACWGCCCCWPVLLLAPGGGPGDAKIHTANIYRGKLDSCNKITKTWIQISLQNWFIYFSNLCHQLMIHSGQKCLGWVIFGWKSDLVSQCFDFLK